MMRRLMVACAILALAFSDAARAETLPGLGGERLSGIRVDIAPLIAKGGGAPAEALRVDLLAALKDSFSDALGGCGPTLVVRIDGMTINPYAGGQGGGGRGFGGGGQTDYLDGEALLIGRRGEVIARRPQLSATPASSGGAWYDPDSERRRVTALAEHYAWWLRRSPPSP